MLVILGDVSYFRHREVDGGARSHTASGKRTLSKYPRNSSRQPGFRAFPMVSDRVCPASGNPCARERPELKLGKGLLHATPPPPAGPGSIKNLRLWLENNGDLLMGFGGGLEEGRVPPSTWKFQKIPRALGGGWERSGPGVVVGRLFPPWPGHRSWWLWRRAGLPLCSMELRGRHLQWKPLQR